MFRYCLKWLWGSGGGRPVEYPTEVRNNALGKAIARLGVQIPGVFYAGGLKCHRIIRVLQHGKDMSVFTRPLHLGKYSYTAPSERGICIVSLCTHTEKVAWNQSRLRDWLLTPSIRSNARLYSVGISFRVLWSYSSMRRSGNRLRSLFTNLP
jgi:hypothetical protein